MKRVVVLALFLSLISTSVFGVLAMAQGEHAGCVASVAEGKSCPPQANALDSINFHSNAFRKISTAILDAAGIPGVMLVVVGLALLFFAKTAGLVRQGTIISILAPQRVAERVSYTTATSPTRSWLIRHFNSPTVA